MTTLTIRNVPEVQVNALKVRAAVAGKSVEQLMRDVVADMTKPSINFGCRPEWRTVADDLLLDQLEADELEAWHS